MGESKKDALRVNFDRKLKVEFHGAKVTSDAGLLAYRELDEVLELTTMIESELTDSRTGKNALPPTCENRIPYLRFEVNNHALTNVVLRRNNKIQPGQIDCRLSADIFFTIFAKITEPCFRDQLVMAEPFTQDLLLN